MAQSESQLGSLVETTSGLLLHLGFIVNPRKCHTDPKQTIKFLDFVVDSKQMTLSLPSSKGVNMVHREVNYSVGVTSPRPPKHSSRFRESPPDRLRRLAPEQSHFQDGDQ